MRALAAAALSLLAVLVAGCGSGTGGVVEGGNVARGKQLFLKGENGKPSCAACHTLRAAGASGKIGPDLDYAFGSDYMQGFEESTIRQVVADQIKFPGDYGAEGPTMPANLVTGEGVDDVAAYVASVAGFRKGKGGGGTTTTAPPAETTGGGGALAAGKKAFDDNGCGACHKLEAAGSSGTIGPDLDKLKSFAQTAGMPLEQFVRESIVDPNAYVEKGFPQGVMPTTFNTLPKPALDALVQFLVQSAKG